MQTPRQTPWLRVLTVAAPTPGQGVPVPKQGPSGYLSAPLCHLIRLSAAESLPVGPGRLTQGKRAGCCSGYEPGLHSPFLGRLSRLPGLSQSGHCTGSQPSLDGSHQPALGSPSSGTVERSWEAEYISQICGNACPGVTKAWATVCAVTRISPETPAKAAFNVMFRVGTVKVK